MAQPPQTPGTAGTRDTRVDRIEEGLPGLATTDNPTANPPSRASFDVHTATAPTRVVAQAQIDTTQTDGLSTPYNVKRANPGEWA